MQLLQIHSVDRYDISIVLLLHRNEIYRSKKIKFENATYYVMNGHTFGYMFNEQPGFLGVLASKPQLGADWSEEPKTVTAVEPGNTQRF